MSQAYFTGLLLPGGFDPEGRCISIQLYTREERVYLVTDGTGNQNLEPFFRQTVCIEGEILTVGGEPQIVAFKVRSQAEQQKV